QVVYRYLFREIKRQTFFRFAWIGDRPISSIHSTTTKVGRQSDFLKKTTGHAAGKSAKYSRKPTDACQKPTVYRSSSAEILIVAHSSITLPLPANSTRATWSIGMPAASWRKRVLKILSEKFIPIR